MHAIGRQALRAPDGAPIHYERHRPEETTLCRMVQQHAAIFEIVRDLNQKQCVSILLAEQNTIGR